MEFYEIPFLVGRVLSSDHVAIEGLQATSCMTSRRGLHFDSLLSAVHEAAQHYSLSLFQ